MEQNLKEKAIGGFVWMFLERIGAQIVTFIVSLLLARVLTPDDYGTVAIGLVFINLANVFVAQGLNAAIIQRDEVGELEYSTAFFANLCFAAVSYCILFLGAPYIARYYNNDILDPLFKVLGLRLFFGALNAIQRAHVSRNLHFKKFFYATLGGTVISAVVGIIMALAGFGAWAIVGQYLTNSIIDTIMLWFIVPWHPKFIFSMQALKEMIGFGWKVFAAAFFNQIYLELRSFVIAKRYSSSDLAYYNRGRQFPELFYTNIVATITSVMFPIMSKQKNDLSVLKNNFKKTVQMLVYIITPIMVGLIATSKPLVQILLTEKWLPCVPFLIAYCVSYTILPIQAISEQVYKAVGRSDIVLKLFFIEKIIGILVILFSMRYSVWAIAIGMMCTAFLNTMLHIIPMNRVINYSVVEMLGDILPLMVLSIPILMITYLIDLLAIPILLKLFTQITFSVIYYIAVSMMFHIKVSVELLQIINHYIRK